MLRRLHLEAGECRPADACGCCPRAEVLASQPSYNVGSGPQQEIVEVSGWVRVGRQQGGSGGVREKVVMWIKVRGK